MLQIPVKSGLNSSRIIRPSYNDSRNDQLLHNVFKKNLKMENQTTNVILLSSVRSGGAFLGQLLNNINPDTFYSIDPLAIAATELKQVLSPIK